MSLRTSTAICLLCGILSACAAEKKLVGDAGIGEGDDLDAAMLDSGDGEEVIIGDPIDVDGDGDLDGEAVDTDGDGVPDGVDTDGDGDVDEPLPPDSIPVAGDAAVPAPANDAGTPAAGDAAPTPFPANDAGQILCGDAPCACSDGKDNDVDGVSDLADPECVSSWDNDEGSFATGIPGDNRDDACQDCFFDGNSGSGNDGCYLPSSCLSKGDNSSGRGRCSSCEQTAQCRKFCQAYTPNGCDCFGCCTVRLANGTNVNVALGNGCNIDGNTVTGCNTCVPNDSCINTCGRCELCPGKTAADLPADCMQTPPPPADAGTSSDSGTSDSGTGTSDSGTPPVGGSDDAGTTPPPPPPPVYNCDNGATVCGAGLPACPSSYSCDFGCCTLIPIILL